MTLYKFNWDTETGGVILLPEQEKMSMEPRPVYAQELDLLGFDKFWKYKKDNNLPIMWAENNNYYYRGELIAKTKGGSLYSAPELIILDNGIGKSAELSFVDVPLMIEKNSELLQTLSQETIKKVYNIYQKYKRRVDVFYVAFSGGKDSIVALDIIQKTLPHDDFMVIFGDTCMEFNDTYGVINATEDALKKEGIKFFRARSSMNPLDSWRYFGPPSTAVRWCCSVHKTSPQINLIRKIIGKDNFTGMAFTGVRAEESLKRSIYTDVSQGKKHQGQYSCHTILDWNSAEVFLYIFSNDLFLNEAYKKGNARAGCLVCPNSTGKHEFVKHSVYKDDVDKFLSIIYETSGKTNFTKQDMKDFIDEGFWRTRKTGKELNFGQDKFEIHELNGDTVINVFLSKLNWIEWGKTLGDINQVSESQYRINFQNEIYDVFMERNNKYIQFRIPRSVNSKTYIKFKSIFRSVIIKSIYCIHCGICEAECKSHCISMGSDITVSNNCTHCLKCHNVRDHCMRYSSIRNKNSEGKSMAGLDRYFTFGSKSDWLKCFFEFEGGEDFWNSDGNGQVQNKKKDAFLHFLKDAGLVEYKKTINGNKYTKNITTNFFKKLINIDNEEVVWAYILANIVYTPTFNWIVNYLQIHRRYTPDELKDMLADVMENDTKGLGRRNIVDSLKIFFAKTPLGSCGILGNADVNIKSNASGEEKIKLNFIERVSWQHPDDKVILYSLYKFSEKCGGIYQFSLESLLDDTIEREGISPTKIFGLDRETMIPILNGLSANYPAFISVSFNLDLDQITLRNDKQAEDVLDLL